MMISEDFKNRFLLMILIGQNIYLFLKSFNIV